jgi:hypothetical protein
VRRRRREPSGDRCPACDAVHRHTLALALALLAWVVLVACRGDADVPTDPREDGPTIQVEGCTPAGAGACRRPPPGAHARCEEAVTGDAHDPPDATRLRVWAYGGGVDQLRLDGRPADVLRETMARWDVLAPADAQRLAVTRAGAEVWTVALEPAPVEPQVLAEARDALGGARAGVALARLLATLDGLPDPVLGAALDLVMDLEHQLAKQQDREVPLEHAMQAFERALARGEVDRASCHARRAIFEAVDRADFDLANAWLERLSAIEGISVRTEARNAYYRGLVFRALGDLHHARKALELAEAGAVAHDDLPTATASREQLAEVSAGLGRELELAQRLDSMTRDEGSLACQPWLRTLNGAGWARLLARDVGRPASDPIPDLQTALFVASWVDDAEDRCFDPALVEHLRINLALAAEAEGWIGWAEQLRAELPAPDEVPVERRFWLEQLDYRLALARGDRGELVELSMRDTTADPRPQYVWLREYTRGRALEAVGLPSDALEAYAQADAALQSIMLRVDVDEGRDRLLLGRQPSSARRIALLTELGRVDESLCVARVARARTSHALDRAARVAALGSAERRAWSAAIGRYEATRRRIAGLREERWAIPGARLAEHDAAIAAADRELDAAARDARELLGAPPVPDSCDDLRAPAPGELLLLYFPMDEHWIGFSVDAPGNVTSHTLPHGDRSALLEPFAAQIRAARSIRVLPTAELWALPFASLPFDGAPLVEHAPVVVSLDLRRRTGRTSRPTSALLVGDPRGDLAAAATEARRVASRLEALDVRVELLVGPEARSESWRERIGAVDLFHYAGHGSHDAFEGWGSSIRLARDELIDVTDVLSLPRVPSVAVLPACETAAAGDPGLGGAMNIARAFVLAGSDLVIAASTEIEDEVALELVSELYAADAPAPGNGAAALRRAQLHLHDPQRWSVFALVP